MDVDLNNLNQQLETLRQQIRRQEKMASLGVLSAGIAHEIQNPLNFVINFSKMSAKLLDDLQENLAKIQEHGERASSIIRGILLQSRGKSGEKLPTDVGQLVHEYVWLSYHAMRANDKSFNITIHENIQENMPRVMVIPQDLSRAVLNVMNNACYTVKERAGQEGEGYSPTIDVNVSLAQHGADEGELSIAIADNGMGMTPEVKEKIFDNFFTTKPAGQGTGLGMAITYEIITKNHNGKLLVDTEPKAGTTFTFIIPVKITK